MGILREHLGARLRVIRAERGYSQQNVADLIGMSLPGYAKMEQGRSDVSIDRIENLSSALRVSVAELLGLETGTMNISNTGPGNVIGRENKLDSTGMAELVRELIDRVVKLECELHKKEKAR